MRAATMKERPSFPVMRQTDVQTIYHMQMPCWLFSDSRHADMSLEGNLDKPVKNSTACIMVTIFNCIAESESDLMVDPYLNGLRRPPDER